MLINTVYESSFSGVKEDIHDSCNGILDLRQPHDTRPSFPQSQAGAMYQAPNCVGYLLLILHVELGVLLRLVGDAVLVTVVVHLYKVTQSNFLISLGSAKDSG